MKKILFPLFVLVFSTTLLAQSGQPDAEYLLLRRSYTINSDGSMDVRFRKEIKLLRNRAVTAYALNGETFIEYNPQFETLTINECYTLLPDGSRVEPRQSAYVDQLPSHCADCSRLNNIREMAIIHTGLEEGCTVVLDYTLHRQTTRLWEHFDMMQRYPVKHYEVIVNGEMWRNERNIPQDDWSAQPYAVKPTRYEIDVQLGELPQWTGERWLANATNVDTLADMPQMERAEAVCRWVRDNVVCHHGLDLARLDYAITPAATVYADNCGTPADVVAMTTAMLNRVGIDATLVRDSTVNNIAESFRIEVIIDKIHYCINPFSRQTWTPVGAAVDDNAPLVIDSTLAYHPQEMADGYSRITLPADEGTMNINPALLVPSRNIPVAVKPCDESYRYTIELPRKTDLVGGKQEVSYSVDGVGSIEITVKQKGRKLIVSRHIVITCDEVDMEHYAEFRHMMQEWKRGREFFVK